MKPAPLITVVVPVYNQERYLSRCFDGLLAQTLPHWQAVLVDDGSTGGSGADGRWSIEDPYRRR